MNHAYIVNNDWCLSEAKAKAKQRDIVRMLASFLEEEAGVTSDFDTRDSSSNLTKPQKIVI